MGLRGFIQLKFRWINLIDHAFKIRIAGACLLLGPLGFNWCFLLLQISESYSAPRDLNRRAAYCACESSFLFILVVIMIYLFVHVDSFTSKRFTTSTEQITKCYEPLQKMRVRLGPCETGLSHPVILYY